MLGAGKTEGAMDAANMLKPMLARGELRCIGATTIVRPACHAGRPRLLSLLTAAHEAPFWRSGDLRRAAADLAGLRRRSTGSTWRKTRPLSAASSRRAPDILFCYRIGTSVVSGLGFL